MKENILKTLELETLYSRDSFRRIKRWNIVVHELEALSLITIAEGLLNGTLNYMTRNVLKGKNIKKSNETTPFEQACKEAQSQWNYKKLTGYKSLEDLNIKLVQDLEAYLPLTNTDLEDQVKPMKANPFYNPKTNKVKMTFPCIGQPKINGFRCFAYTKTFGLFEEKQTIFSSKNGLKYTILEHIEKELISELFSYTGKSIDLHLKNFSLIFDGEMYIPNFSLQQISSAIRKRNENTIKLEYHIFDLAIPDLNQEERTYILNEIASNLPSLSYVKFVQSTKIESIEAAEAFTDKCISEGYEGAIFRDLDLQYQFGIRSPKMCKLKRTIDEEFEILDVKIPESGDANYAVLVCKNNTNDEIFDCSIKGSFEYRTKLYEDRENLIGKKATIQYRERTLSDKPFHTVCLSIRDYE
jgi:ATP-dependent DNA ligase